MSKWQARLEYIKSRYVALGLMFVRVFVRHVILIPSTCLLIRYFCPTGCRKIVEIVFLANAVIVLLFIVYYLWKIVSIFVGAFRFKNL
ncbi:hypothetical protein DGI_2440 [Megalodesulfovibrio gigas DSM 1382 = ATCC 19364]|uniref:Uncharacterized protein n=1 Tax=Megalodesulfovibrio gigas (strain ATCC 19364 / DSM 1382 / NCIMB 9332 / VKM B-1759) TaxID=1121448 RepID=T2GC89_MEGG1|nr:hypothetical protein DGI_2440 [Megalodesulfovibrio gigas DSM 1382 = ATCC 19364]